MHHGGREHVFRCRQLAQQTGGHQAGRSAVACRAIGEMLRVDMIGRHKILSLLGLVPRRRPGHVEHALARTQVRGGVTMTVEAPAHRERNCLARQRHLIDRAMTCRTADTVGHMCCVVKVDIIRKIMDAPPAEGPIVGKACADWCKHAGIGPYLRVAGHAGFRRWNSCEASLFH